MDLTHRLYQLRWRLRRWLPYAGRFPVHVDLELAGKCQLACTMCPYGDKSFDDSLQGMMPRGMALDALRQARAGGASSLKLNFRGEPGLCRWLDAMVFKAKALGFVEVMINTNLTAFTHDRLRKLVHSGLDLCIISIDGATAATYERIRVKGDFDKLVSNLRLLHSLPDRPRIRLQMVVQDSNRHEVSVMRRRFGPLCDELVFQAIRESNDGARRRCAQPWQRLIVAWDGQVFACCSNWANEFPVGDFKTQSLTQIWKGGALARLRKFAADPPSGWPCADCKVGDSYKHKLEVKA